MVKKPSPAPVKKPLQVKIKLAKGVKANDGSKGN